MSGAVAVDTYGAGMEPGGSIASRNPAACTAATASTSSSTASDATPSRFGLRALRTAPAATGNCRPSPRSHCDAIVTPTLCQAEPWKTRRVSLPLKPGHTGRNNQGSPFGTIRLTRAGRRARLRQEGQLTSPGTLPVVGTQSRPPGIASNVSSYVAWAHSPRTLERPGTLKRRGQTN